MFLWDGASWRVSLNDVCFNNPVMTIKIARVIYKPFNQMIFPHTTINITTDSRVSLGYNHEKSAYIKSSKNDILIGD